MWSIFKDGNIRTGIIPSLCIQFMRLCARYLAIILFRIYIWYMTVNTLEVNNSHASMKSWYKR